MAIELLKTQRLEKQFDMMQVNQEQRDIKHKITGTGIIQIQQEILINI